MNATEWTLKVRQILHDGHLISADAEEHVAGEMITQMAQETGLSEAECWTMVKAPGWWDRQDKI